jgi:hypothetical protein
MIRISGDNTSNELSRQKPSHRFKKEGFSNKGESGFAKTAIGRPLAPRNNKFERPRPNYCKIPTLREVSRGLFLYGKWGVCQALR